MTAIPRKSDEIGRVLRAGVSRVDQLFTRRNLIALSSILRQVAGVTDEAQRSKLLFALTGSVPRASRTNKYIPRLRSAPGPLLGTMYLPGIFAELNVGLLYRRKLRDAARAASEMADASGGVADRLRVQVASATRLAGVPDDSIDYVFTDPPFGANIAYSELNLMWEAWLGCRTDAKQEAVVSRSQGKSVDDYGELMRRSFAEMARVLKPGRWMTLVFHNTSGEVWHAILRALLDARFEPKAVLTFDKAHETFKQVTADGAVGYDVVVNSRLGTRRRRLATADRPTIVRYLADQLAATGVPADRAGRRMLYSRTVAHFLSVGSSLSIDYREFRDILQRVSRDS